MFTKIFVKNFKSFREFEIDLVESNTPKKIKKNLFIYGENGSGKSNIVEIFSFFIDSTSTLKSSAEYADMIAKFQNEKLFLAAPETFEKYLLEHPYTKKISLNTLVSSVKTIGKNKKNENMIIKLNFLLEDASGEGRYEMRFNDDGNLIYEALDYIIDKKIGNLYTLENINDEIKIKFSPRFFHPNQRKFRDELEYDIQTFWGKNSLLAIFINKIIESNAKKLVDAVNFNFFEFVYFFNKVSVLQKDSNNKFKRTSNRPLRIFDKLEKGSIKIDDEGRIQELEGMEEILSNFFTALYADIERVEYEKIYTEDNLTYRLFFHKRISGEVSKIPFDQESQGTRNLLELFPSLVALINGEIIIIDEIDTGIHDVLMSEIITRLLEDSTGQFIVTTHNTQLLETLEPNKVGIIAVDSYGNKFMNLLQNSDKKTNNNLLYKYQRGDFFGIPEPFGIDFSYINELITSLTSLVEEKNEKVKKNKDGDDDAAEK